MDDRAHTIVEDRVIIVFAILSEAVRAAFFAAMKSSERKYQQRGRCTRLPPTVAMLRICGVAIRDAASDKAPYFFLTDVCSSSCESVTRGPIRRPSLSSLILSRPWIWRMLTRRDGLAIP